MKEGRHLSLLAIAFAAWLMTSLSSLGADEVLPSLQIGTNKLTNVSVLLNSPVDLLLKHDKGHLRVKLQDLPEPLKSKYPYNAQKADDYARLNSTSKRIDAVALRERQLRATLKQLATEEDVIREKRRVLRGKKGAPDRGKMKNFEEDITKLANQQKALEAELSQLSALRYALQQEVTSTSNSIASPANK
ncbi:MAG TPA: hypothetical protein VGH19_08395 [Verrucomicrobiae bacterium]